MFIDRNARVGVSDEQGNVIYVREKMDVKTKGLVSDALASLSSDVMDGSGEGDIALRLGSHNCVLLVHNIVAWEGPAFVDARGRAIPCTREWIERLDPDEPLVDKVLGEINTRNVRPESPDPNSPTPGGSMNAGG